MNTKKKERRARKITFYVLKEIYSNLFAGVSAKPYLDPPESQICAHNHRDYPILKLIEPITFQLLNKSPFSIKVWEKQ